MTWTFRVGFRTSMTGVQVSLAARLTEAPAVGAGACCAEAAAETPQTVMPDDPEQRFPAVVRAADVLLAVTREAA